MLRFLPLLLCSLLSCHSPEKRILGKWSMEKVSEYGADVTKKHNPEGNRWIEFRSDGSFISGGAPFGRNTGQWTIRGQDPILFLDSEVDDDDSEWKVTFEGNNTIWTGVGHPRKENTQLVHRRADR
jgi:hypothetical protein